MILLTFSARAQMPDGYFYTYNQIHFPGTRWTNLQIEHELYCHGHLIEAGVSHHEAAGSQTFYSILSRTAADRIVADFLGKGPELHPRASGDRDSPSASLPGHQTYTIP